MSAIAFPLCRAAHSSRGHAVLAALLLALALGAGGGTLAAQAGGTTLADAVSAMDGVFDRDEAWRLLESIDPYYRARGNRGYTRSLRNIYDLLKEAGFVEGGGEDTVDLRDFGPLGPAWTPNSARLEVVSPGAVVLHAFETESGLERTFLCINSFPTPPGGVTAPLVRFDPSRPADYYAGTVVFGDGPAEDELFKRAVQQGGALGVISSYLGHYNRPDENRHAIRYCIVPYDPVRKGFALNVSPDRREVLERLLDGGSVYVKVTIDVQITETRSRTLVARIGGTDPEAGTVAMVGHLSEPGANDNGSGVAAMASVAAGYLRALRDGRLERPRRSLTFLWGNEFECSREWLKSRRRPVDMALVIDMVGEDLDITGAMPLMERMPDPGAIWDERSPLDQHSEWGRPSDLRESDLRGSFVNDYVMAALRVRQESNGWPVRSNPFEGGSDHESFLERGIPAVLLWHFTDVYYHTNLDRLDKVSAAEMENMAVPLLGLMHHFAQAGPERAEEVLGIVLDAARHRLAVEAEYARRSLELPAVADNQSQREAVARRERRILFAWSRWYRQALLSVEAFDPGPTYVRHLDLQGRIDRALSEIRQIQEETLEGF